MYSTSTVARARHHAMVFLGAHPSSLIPILVHHRLQGSGEETENNGTKTDSVGTSATSALSRAG